MLKFLKDEKGATAIEYGLIAAAIGLALITAFPSAWDFVPAWLNAKY